MKTTQQQSRRISQKWLVVSAILIVLPLVSFAAQAASPTQNKLLYLPMITTASPNVRVSEIVYDGRGDEKIEHIHVCNDGLVAQDLSGWQMRNPSANASYTFPNGASAPAQSCNEDADLTINTSYAENVDGVRVFNWAYDTQVGIWPDDQGTVELYLPDGDLALTCSYVTSPTDEGEAEVECEKP